MNPYVEQIGRTHPGVEVEAAGPLYEDVVWRNSPPIPKAALDAEIAVAPSRKTRLPLTVEELATQMIRDGTMTQAKIDAIKNNR